jgi:glucose-6-phosphate dehydrogenase assembly protein OpcA
VIVIASGAALEEVHDALETLVRSSSVRPIVLTLGDHPEARRSDRHGTTVIEGLLPRYLNNAVASLRLSSLPAIAWWRVPSADGLSELAHLVDRLVFDVDDPVTLWHLVPLLSERTAVGDLRWARLTRWRDIFAQFFDLPDVLQASDAFTRIDISAGDPHAARLLAGWIRSRLPRGERLPVSIGASDGAATIRSLELAGDSLSLSLRLLPNDVCIETVVRLPGMPPSSRVVPASEQGIAALMGQELRIRARDVAFEDAVAAAGGIA